MTARLPHVYLAGAITGLPSRGAPWRDRVAELLSPLVSVNPLHLELDANNPREVVTKDLAAIRICQALLVNAVHPSWGTAMEIWCAREYGVPVITFNVHKAGKDAFKPSPWLLYCSTETHVNMADAINSIRERFRAYL